MSPSCWRPTSRTRSGSASPRSFWLCSIFGILFFLVTQVRRPGSSRSVSPPGGTRSRVASSGPSRRRPRRPGCSSSTTRSWPKPAPRLPRSARERAPRRSASSRICAPRPRRSPRASSPAARSSWPLSAARSSASCAARSARLAVELSEKIVGQRLSDDAAMRSTVDAFLADIERQQAGSGRQSCMIHAASRAALAALRERLNEVLPALAVLGRSLGLRSRRWPPSCTSAADLLAGPPRLRRTLADASTDASNRADLLRGCSPASSATPPSSWSPYCGRAALVLALGPGRLPGDPRR